MSLELIRRAMGIKGWTPVKKMVLLALCERADDNGIGIWARVNTLAATACCGEKSVRVYIHELADEGIISRLDRQAGSSSYICLDPSAISKAAESGNEHRTPRQSAPDPPAVTTGPPGNEHRTPRQSAPDPPAVTTGHKPVLESVQEPVPEEIPLESSKILSTQIPPPIWAAVFQGVSTGLSEDDVRIWYARMEEVGWKAGLGFGAVPIENWRSSLEKWGRQNQKRSEAETAKQQRQARGSEPAKPYGRPARRPSDAASR